MLCRWGIIRFVLHSRYFCFVQSEKHPISPKVWGLQKRYTGLAKSCIDWRSTLIKMGTRKKIFSDFEDLDHFASIAFHYVACLNECGRFLESFLVAQYRPNPLVQFYLVCRSDARHSDNWPALVHVIKPF